jgi:hypothetical protein
MKKLIIFLKKRSYGLNIYKLINLKPLFQNKNNDIIKLHKEINEKELQFLNEQTPDILKNILKL